MALLIWMIFSFQLSCMSANALLPHSSQCILHRQGPSTNAIPGERHQIPRVTAGSFLPVYRVLSQRNATQTGAGIESRTLFSLAGRCFFFFRR
ncbi:hypothetical protein F5050DRAFT_1785742 [Lentinula boryana]|uniref:Secreted protein n=1 Tax=Lentinula boryana TaxID=40481 RepID=A0ABQ8Q3C6_9AGAR|nr:hypothetical protein F5050DRAFT_1785742 [Lentinula boryana]